MLNTKTNFLMLVLRMDNDSSWKRQPREMMEDNMPVRLSEMPNSFVRVARKEPATKMEIKYSKAASSRYINLLRFRLHSEGSCMISISPHYQENTFGKSSLAFCSRILRFSRSEMSAQAMRAS